MPLSNDLISQFAKLANSSNDSTKKETKLYGTIVVSDGKKYVRLDGSNIDTPISSVTDALNGDRVTVEIKNHTAIVTGNLTSPSINMSTTVSNPDGTSTPISNFGMVMAEMVKTSVLEAESARIDELVANNVTINEKLTVAEADIDTLEADNVTINETLTAANADIVNLKADVVTVNGELSAQNAKIVNLEATDADFRTLESDYATFKNATVEDLESVNATITNLDATYANIDFSNIGKAAIEYFYSTSGLIENVVVGDGTITGNLVGVTIKGDLIEGNTVVADKLVIKGEDGLYYKLNTDGVTTEAEQTEYNSINGSIITANSITATKISVDDLVAFDATIGGFNITNNSIYSGVKETVDNTTSGVYMDNEGQLALGDANSYVKYYKDAEGNYILDISAGSILFGSSQKNIEDVDESVSEVQIESADINARVSVAESLITQLSDQISSLVVDENGLSLMTQTESGWVFSIEEIQSALDNAANNVDTLYNDVNSLDGAIDVLNNAVNDLGNLSNYVRITTVSDQPCIELGSNDSDFKLLITNTDIRFMEAEAIPAWITNQELYIERAVINNEFQIGDFVWKKRDNGNVGIMWKE